MNTRELKLQLDKLEIAVGWLEGLMNWILWIGMVTFMSTAQDLASKAGAPHWVTLIAMLLAMLAYMAVWGNLKLKRKDFENKLQDAFNAEEERKDRAAGLHGGDKETNMNIDKLSHEILDLENAIKDQEPNMNVFMWVGAFVLAGVLYAVSIKLGVPAKLGLPDWAAMIWFLIVPTLYAGYRDKERGKRMNAQENLYNELKAKEAEKESIECAAGLYSHAEDDEDEDDEDEDDEDEHDEPVEKAPKKHDTRRR